jgi:hypothetical protein
MGARMSGSAMMTSRVLTSSTVRQWIASLKVEEFLMGRKKAPKAAAVEAAPVISLYEKSTGEDFDQFLKMMQNGQRPFRKPGLTVRQEFELWLAHKATQNQPVSQTESQNAA